MVKIKLFSFIFLIVLSFIGCSNQKLTLHKTIEQKNNNTYSKIENLEKELIVLEKK